jgi:hypothetical protein
LDCRDGQGRHTYANGDTYEGGWREDRKYGKGRCIYANGDEYEGEWTGV